MNALLVTALRAAEAAAEVHLAHFREVSVESAREKSRSDFVTAVDLEAQRAAIRVIRGTFPDHLVLAEEETDPEGGGDGCAPPSGSFPRGPGVPDSWTSRSWPEDGGYLWIIDPLDGTTNYLHGHPMFAASVGVGRGTLHGADDSANPGLRFAGCLEAGAVVAPRTQERWWASRGEGAWKNGRPIAVSGLRDLRKALVGTGFPFKEPHLVPRYVEELGRVLPGSGGVRRGGSAALDLCYLAEGIFDAFWEEDYLSPWDTAAGLAILSEAGGVASRMDGSPVDLEDGSILAANSPELLAALGGHLRPSR